MFLTDFVKKINLFCGFQRHILNGSYSLLTKITDGLPVVVMDSKPLTVSRSNVDVYRTEVVVLLVS